MTALPPLSVSGTDDTFDARWQRWQDAGRAQDTRLRRHARAAGVLLLLGVATWLAAVLFAA